MLGALDDALDLGLVDEALAMSRQLAPVWDARGYHAAHQRGPSSARSASAPDQTSASFGCALLVGTRGSACGRRATRATTLGSSSS